MGRKTAADYQTSPYVSKESNGRRLGGLQARHLWHLVEVILRPWRRSARPGGGMNGGLGRRGSAGCGVGVFVHPTLHNM